jgi:hypothetical protein
VASGPEVLGDGTIGGEAPLGVPWGLEPWHPPFALAGGLVGVLRAVIQIPALPMVHAWEDLPLGGTVTFQFVGDDHAGDISVALEELAENLLGGPLGPPALHQDLEPVPLPVDGAPQIVPCAVDREAHFVQVPCVTGSGAPTPELVGILLAKFPTPLADGLIGDDDATNKEQLFDIPIAETEPERQPDTVADNLHREAVVLIAVR